MYNSIVSLKERAIESAKSRLALAEHNLIVSSGNDATIARKERAVEVARYILCAVKAYQGDINE